MNAKIDEDIAGTKQSLSQANLEKHNQQSDASITSESIKDIDASSDDSDYLLAAVFDEQAHNIVNTSLTSVDMSSANSTQIIESNFELDSNKAYSQVSSENEVYTSESLFCFSFESLSI